MERVVELQFADYPTHRERRPSDQRGSRDKPVPFTLLPAGLLGFCCGNSYSGLGHLATHFDSWYRGLWHV